MSNGSVVPVAVKADEEDIWVCKRCGWTYPNRHPSARHRRNHRKHCGKVKGFEVLKEKQSDRGGGSSDDVSSDEDSSLREKQEAEGVATVDPKAEEINQTVAEGNGEDKASSATVTPIYTEEKGISTPDDPASHPPEDSAAHSELWEQLLDAHVADAPPAPLEPANTNARNALIDAGSKDTSGGEDAALNPFGRQAPIIDHEHSCTDVPANSQSTDVPGQSGKNPFLPANGIEAQPGDDKGKAEASSSASWESIKPHVALQSLFEEDQPKQSEYVLEEHAPFENVPPPKRTNSNVLKKVIENVRSSPAKLSGGTGTGGGVNRHKKQQQQQQQRSWWSNYICCTPRIS